MNFTEAIKVLRRYQDLCRGSDVRTMAAAGLIPGQQFEAVDTVLAHFGASEPLTVCAGCLMARLDDCGDPIGCGAEKCVKGKE